MRAVDGSSTGKRTNATSRVCASRRRSRSTVVDSSMTRSTRG
ncbi:Uncharacterised protein [Bordetella pertussis]|nr:Uncharacterised protein [Bordetella pertussis]